MKNEIIQKIERGMNLPRVEKILHTSPHHDDEMLAYYSLIPKLLQENENSFAYFSAGHHSVSDDLAPTQELKTLIREQEAEKMLAQFNVTQNIYHLRLPFYDKDATDFEEDIAKVVPFLDKVQPTILTLADDPPEVGPTTHAKVFQIIQKAVKRSSIKPTMIGYRNVWSRYTLEEANLLYPVTENEFKAMNQAFIQCYLSQNGNPFSAVSEKIQRQQFEEVKSILGESFFRDHPHSQIRNAEGFIFLVLLNNA